MAIWPYSWPCWASNIRWACWWRRPPLASCWSAPTRCIAAMAAGGLLSLIVAVYGVSLRGQQITVGLGVLVFGLGLASLIYRAVVGVQLQSPRVDVIAPL